MSNDRRRALVNELLTLDAYMFRLNQKQEMRIMSDFTISSTMPQLQALVAAKIKQPDATTQATVVKAVSGVADQIAATLASISSGVDIQA